tara:strand:- start:201 stop:380 length:180 start_codon:yes stop_codon:yes gene_type:complete
MIKSFLKKMKINKLRKKIQRLQADAVHYQRNGNLRMLGYITSEIQELENKLLDLQDDQD